MSAGFESTEESVTNLFCSNVSGIVFSESKVWQTNRRFGLSHLRDLGMGKSSLQDTIMTEVTALIQNFDQHLNQPFELTWSINIAILNVIWGLVASKSFYRETIPYVVN